VGDTGGGFGSSAEKGLEQGIFDGKQGAGSSNKGPKQKRKLAGENRRGKAERKRD